MPFANIHGVKLYYESVGDGEPVVFLHGYTGSGRDWRHQAAAITPGRRALTLDNRGHGKSDAPTSEDEYSIEIFSEDVYALLKILGIASCTLVGHSMGGFMALQFTLDHPEMVSRLILVDTSSGEFEVAPGFAELRAKLDEIAGNQGMEAAFEYDVAHNPVRIERLKRHPELREVTRQKMLATSVDGYIYTARTFRKLKPVTDRLGEIHVPTRIFWGEEDAGFERPSKILKEGIANSKLVTVPGVGHSPHEEASEIFNKALLEFLSE